MMGKMVTIHEGAVIEEGAIIHDFVVIYPNVIIKKGAEIFEHSVIGKMPKAPGCTARETISGYRQTVIGEDTIVSPGSIVYTGTVIGHNTLLGDNCSIREECKIGDYCIISRNVTVNYNTVIGNRTKIMDNTHITGNAVIEDNVFISVLVATTNDNAMGRAGYDAENVRGPYIKKNTTIGAGANILPGITIGENCIIGASSLITKDVPDNKVVMGVPGRVVRDIPVKGENER
ncbi:MAG: transferase [Roseburia sp.]|nr:transferase [Roseburia sp.]